MIMITITITPTISHMILIMITITQNLVIDCNHNQPQLWTTTYMIGFETKRSIQEHL